MFGSSFVSLIVQRPKITVLVSVDFFSLMSFQTLSEMREDIQNRCYGLCTASTSITELCAHREIARPRGGTCVPSGLKASVANQFLPNCRRIVDKLRSKSFCCQFIKGGSELVVASQDERIRFFQQCGPRDRYLLKDTVHVIHCLFRRWMFSNLPYLIHLLDCMNPHLIILRVFLGRNWLYRIRMRKYYVAVGISSLPSDAQNTPGFSGFFRSMAVFSLRFSRRGHEILCGGSDRCLHVFDLESMSRIVTIPDAHGDDINAVCYGDTESHLLYSGGDDGLVKVYDRRAFGEMDFQPVGAFAGHRDGITYIDARGDDRHLISNSKDQTVKLWDLRRFSSEETVVCAFFYSGIELFMLRKTINCVRQQSWDYRWQPAPPTTCTPLKGLVLHTLVRAKFSPSRTGRRYIYTGCARGEVVIYDLLASPPSGSGENDTSNPVTRRLPGHVGVVRDVDWNPSCNEIATCAWDGLTAIWKWDERHDHVTSSEVNRIGAEDSCDESYQPVVKRRKAVNRKGKNAKRKQATRGGAEQTDSPELLYTF
ncbi:WD domain, G-beta repeat protein [Ancylostoma duodenale]|uniref:WD domain, G-beta repeat protein n=1 Tax=Ancylostoma duodenale TaxID=51022 RepID=A0A0C2FPU7_9BILA|nr:WD domain, G-beta repeat protein [Ancylostoma duodenale]